jgi:two-component system sensor histidine kinase DegS
LESCEKIVNTDTTKLSEELTRLKDLARINSGELQKIIRHLKPDVIEEHGLIKALERYVDQFRESYAIDAELVVMNKARKLNGIIELSAFRIVQEVLSNVAKHSGAKTCKIKLEFMPDMLNLIISDDGIGFDVNGALGRKKDGFGLLDIRERTDLLTGELKIQSKLGGGSTVSVKIPVG